MSSTRPRLFLGGPKDGEVIQVQEDLRTVCQWAEPPSQTETELVYYTAERVSIFGHKATVYMAQGMTPPERDAAAFQALIRPELTEALTS